MILYFLFALLLLSDRNPGLFFSDQLKKVDLGPDPGFPKNRSQCRGKKRIWIQGSSTLSEKLDHLVKK